MNNKVFLHIYGQFDQVGDRLKEVIQHLFNLDMVFDCTLSFEQLEKYPEICRRIIAMGGLIAPSVYPSYFEPSVMDTNWWKLDEVECERLLRLAVHRYKTFGIGPMDAVTTYTPGNDFIRACRKLGIKYLLGFCAPTLAEDGGWEIAQYGAHLSPYFVSDEDFRKPENPGDRKDSFMIVNMELRNPLVCVEYHVEGPLCPLNTQSADRTLEPGDEPLQYIAFAEDLLKQAEITGRKYFLDINLQYFFTDKCFNINRRAIEWLSMQRDGGRLEVGGIRAWADTLRANEGDIRQSSYWRGEMMGFHPGGRPGNLPDIVVDENLARQASWFYPNVLPQKYYRYLNKWDYPSFIKDGSLPPSECFENIHVETSIIYDGMDSRKLKVSIRNLGEETVTALCLWECLTGLVGPFEICISNSNLSVLEVPNPCGVGGAVIIDGWFAKGEMEFILDIKFLTKRKEHYLKKFGCIVEGRTFYYNRQPYTYLVTQVPEKFFLEAEINLPLCGTPITVERLAGIDYEIESTEKRTVLLKFDGRKLSCWNRIWGVTASQISIDSIDIELLEEKFRKKTEAFVNELCMETGVDPMQVPKPGFQVFTFPGNLQPEEIKTIARMSGDREIKRKNKWLRELNPGIDKILIEAHLGIYSPKGSINKVLSHRFNEIKVGKEFHFQETCADYPLTPEYGISGYVQWRSLNFFIEGLKGKKGDYYLHLHSFDVENRGTFLRVHLYDAGRTEDDREEICIVHDWHLPSGIENRFNPKALVTVKVPHICHTWEKIGIWISPLEGGILYDWIKERGSPGFLSSLWLTGSA